MAVLTVDSVISFKTFKAYAGTIICLIQCDPVQNFNEGRCSYEIQKQSCTHTNYTSLDCARKAPHTDTACSQIVCLVMLSHCSTLTFVTVISWQ